MQPKTCSYLLDAVEACEEILGLAGADANRILGDRVTALAIERLLLVVGEALVRIRDAEPGILESIPDWAAIIGMRNAIVHGYDTIDVTRIRDAIRDDVPSLIAAMMKLLP